VQNAGRLGKVVLSFAVFTVVTLRKTRDFLENELLFGCSEVSKELRRMSYGFKY